MDIVYLSFKCMNGCGIMTLICWSSLFAYVIEVRCAMDSVLIFCYLYCFVFGCCIASFMNVVVYRLPRGISIAKGRSFCGSCHHMLHAIDLIPILSYVFLKGRCRYCHAKISIRHPLIELAGGLLAVLSFAHYGFSLMTPLVFSLAMVLMAITLIDIDTMTIPDQLNIAVGVIAIISLFVYSMPLASRILGAVVYSGGMIGINFLKEESFGGGDIKLCIPLGFMLGIVNMTVGMFLAILVAGIYAIILLLTHNTKLQSHMAFGPFICGGCLIGLLYGGQLATSYLRLFGL